MGARGLQLPFDSFPLFLGLSQPRPGSPGDGLARQAEGAPVSGKLVKVSIGRGVVALSRVADYAGDTGEQYEQVQVLIQGGLVQVPCPQHLGPQDLLEAFPGLVTERAVGEDAHAVNYSGERGHV